MMSSPKAVMAAAALVAATPAQAIDTVYTGAGFTIPDGAFRQSAITITDTYEVDTITFTLRGLNHSAFRDLTANVLHDGKAARLFMREGGSANLDGDYTFDAFAPTRLGSASGFPRPSGTYQFQYVGGLFTGNSVAGRWTLAISDARGGGTGKLVSWSMNVGQAPAVPEPASWAMMIAGFGLVGSAMRRRLDLSKVRT